MNPDDEIKEKEIRAKIERNQRLKKIRTLNSIPKKTLFDDDSIQ